MPSLSSNSNNQESQIKFELKFLEPEQAQGQSWLNYEIIFHKGNETYRFHSINKTATTTLGTEGQIGKFAFAIEPHNELANFRNRLEEFISSEQKNFRFEPADPSFEINIEKIEGSEEFKIHTWVDAGNTRGLEYSWDGIGLRLVVDKTEIENFIQTLDQQ